MSKTKSPAKTMRVDKSIYGKLIDFSKELKEIHLILDSFGVATKGVDGAELTARRRVEVAFTELAEMHQFLTSRGVPRTTLDKDGNHEPNRLFNRLIVLLQQTADRVIRETKRDPIARNVDRLDTPAIDGDMRVVEHIDGYFTVQAYAERMIGGFWNPRLTGRWADVRIDDFPPKRFDTREDAEKYMRRLWEYPVNGRTVARLDVARDPSPVPVTGEAKA